MAEEGRILMYEVHDEGGLFNQHTKNADCAAFGCVPVTAQTDDAQDAARWRWLANHAKRSFSHRGGPYSWTFPFLSARTNTVGEAVDAAMDQETVP